MREFFNLLFGFVKWAGLLRNDAENSHRRLKQFSALIRSTKGYIHMVNIKGMPYIQ